MAVAVVAIVVAVSGGFRVPIGAARVAITSPYRLLFWALLLAVVRHVSAPASPIYRDLPTRARQWWAGPPARAARLVLLGTRPAVLCAGYFAVLMIGYREGGAPYKFSKNEFANLQARWDAGWYVNIAIEGYRYDPAHPEIQQNIVFFPAMPMLTRGLARFLGARGTGGLFGASFNAYMLAGTLLALGAFFGALVYLFRLARDLLGDDDRAVAALWLLAAFPFALFFSAIYSESLYLLGVVGAFYHFRRREFLQAAGWGLLVGLTRPNGCFLSIPLALLAITPWLPAWIAGGPAADRSPDARRWPALVPALAAAAAPGIGVLLYSAFVWQLTGHPLAWAEGQFAWREYKGLTALVTQRYEWLSESGIYVYSANVPDDLLNSLGVLFVLVTAWPVARRLGLAYAIFILINTLPPLAAGGFLSAGRLSSVLFPSFVWLASVVPVRQRPAWIGGFMALQALFAALFYTWRPIF